MIATILSWWKEIAGVFAAVMTAVAWVKAQYAKYEPIVRPMINQAEEDYKRMIADDGVITIDERKEFVMNQVAVLEKLGKIKKLNGIERWILGKIVDNIAQKLDPILTPVNNAPIPPAV